MDINNVRFVIGADPEVFLQSKKTKKFLRASRVYGGSKRNPVRLNYSNDMQVDGMAVEFNPVPSEQTVTFGYRVRSAMRSLSRLASEHDARVVAAPTVEFDDDEWEEATDDEKRLGCDPDYNAWRMDINKAPDASVGFRSGAGHVAIGWGRALCSYARRGQWYRFVTV
jgi:hypothetical protein